MMKIIDKMRKQTAVYWGTPVRDGQGGYSFAAGVELTVRWEDKQELFVDPQGDSVLSRAIVYVGQDVEVDGYFYLGTLASLSSSEVADPTSRSDTHKIRQFGKIPTLKATQYLRQAWL